MKTEVKGLKFLKKFHLIIYYQERFRKFAGD